MFTGNGMHLEGAKIVELLNEGFRYIKSMRRVEDGVIDLDPDLDGRHGRGW